MPHKSVSESYAAIKRVTGLKFDEKNPQDVMRALDTVYIDGHNLLRSKPRLSVDNSAIMSMAQELEAAYSCQSDSFIALMKPDYQEATPKLVPITKAYDRNGNEMQMTPELKARLDKKNLRAEEYAQGFVTGQHQQKLYELREALRGSEYAKTQFRTNEYFSPAYLNRSGSFKNTRGHIAELGTRPVQAAQICNLVLMGRGYTMDELLSKTEEIQAAKKQVGSELNAVMYDEMPEEERSAKFQKLCEEAMSAVRSMRFRPVDFSDESTYENAKYNDLLEAHMSGMGQMMEGQSKDPSMPWAKDAWNELQPLQDFTQTVALFDSERLLGDLSGIEEFSKNLTRQAIIDHVGPAYAFYRTAPVTEAKKAPTLLGDALGFGSALNGGSEFADAYAQFYDENSIGDRKPYMQALENYIKQHQAQFDVMISPLTSDAAPAIGQERDPWVNFGEGFAKNRDAIKASISNGQTSQLDRAGTLKSLIISYACMKQEQEGKQVDLEALLRADDKTKEAYGKEAIAFFQSHPIPAATIELQRENVSWFSRCNAALNRALRALRLPELPLPGTGLSEKQVVALTEKTQLLTDAYQLRMIAQKPGMLSSKEAKDIFFQAYGGKAEFEKVQNQNNIATSTYESLKSTANADRIHKMNPKMLKNSKELIEAMTGTAFKNGVGKDFYGKTIAELPTDRETAQRAMGMTQQVKSIYMPQMQAKMTEARENFKELLTYVNSGGKTDKLNATADMQQALNTMMEEVKKEEAKTEKEGDKREEQREKDYEKNLEEARKAATDWSSELSVDAWKEKLTRMYEDLDSHDPALLRSSKEYKSVKEGVKEAINAAGNPQAFNAAMDKVFSNAGQYLENKKTGQLGKHYGQDRWTAVCNLRDDLAAGGRKKFCSAENLVDAFAVKGATPEEKRADALSRMGEYLKTEEHRALFTRVLEENGKNAVTRNQLRDEIQALTPPERNIESSAAAMRDDLKEMIMPKKTERKLTDYSDFCRAMKTLGGDGFKGAPLGTSARLGELMKKTDSLQRDIYYGRRKDALKQDEAGLMAVRAAVDGMAKLDNTKTTLYLMKGNTLKQLSDDFGQSALAQDMKKQTPEQLKQTFFTSKGRMVNSVAAMKQAKDVLISKGGQSVKQQPAKTKTKAKTQEKKAAAMGQK